MDWGNKLKELRKNRGLYQSDLSIKLNIGQTTISSWENSSNPPIEAIEKICNYFNVPLWQFFAPDDIVIPNIEPNMKLFLEKFKDNPIEVQKLCLAACEAALAAYTFGRSFGIKRS